MKIPKQTLACASSAEFGGDLIFRVTPEEAVALKSCVRKNKTEKFTIDGPAELGLDLWLRTTGLELPRAVTFQRNSVSPISMIVREVDAKFDVYSFRWKLQFRGLNILKNGATGSSYEYHHISLDHPFKASMRTIQGLWQPVQPVQPAQPSQLAGNQSAEAACS